MPKSVNTGLSNSFFAGSTKMKILLVAIICIFISCNKALFVDKSKIIHEGSAYLLFYGDYKGILIPSKNPSIDSFFRDTTKKMGYKIFDDATGFYGLKTASTKYFVEMIYFDTRNKTNKEFTLNDSIYLTTTYFKYLEPHKTKPEWKGPIEFIYKNNRYRIYVSDKYIGIVLQVAGNTM
jgi:hypothetical protein